jgi:hypothetical protein
VVGGTLLVLWLAWQIRVKNTWTGPHKTVDLPPGVSSADELEMEYEDHHPGRHHHGHRRDNEPQDQIVSASPTD